MKILSLEEARHEVISRFRHFGTEEVSLETSLGRVLTGPVQARRNNPPFDVSAMDGYVIHVSDLRNEPMELTVAGEVQTGHRIWQSLSPGHCLGITTGAEIPAEGGAVVRRELTERSSDQRIRIREGIRSGQDIRQCGENFSTGESFFGSGCLITPGILGMLAMLKCQRPEVYKLPRVAILSTGDELEGLYDPVDERKIPDANSYSLLGQLLQMGIMPHILGIARDDPFEIAEFIRTGMDFDIFLISGGASVGQYDYVRQVLDHLGVTLHFSRVAIKPGHPCAFGSTPDNLIFSLPGNPVASMVCFDQLVAPLLRRCMGHQKIFRSVWRARLQEDIPHSTGRTEFVRISLNENPGGVWMAAALKKQGSGMLSGMAEADGFVCIPRESTGLCKGDEVEVIPLDHMLYRGESMMGH